jgi:hypothetical protein
MHIYVTFAVSFQGGGRMRLSDLEESESEDYEEAMMHAHKPGGKVDEFGDMGSYSN